MPSVRKSNRQNDMEKVETQFNQSDMRGMWQDLQIADYKGKSRRVVDTDALLLDKLNTFFARFEGKKTQCRRRRPQLLTRAVSSRSP
jgi:hypothetical protein